MIRDYFELILRLAIDRSQVVAIVDPELLGGRVMPDQAAGLPLGIT